MLLDDDDSKPPRISELATEIDDTQLSRVEPQTFSEVINLFGLEEMIG